MNERLQQALSFAKYRQTLNNQLQKLKIRSQGALLYSKNGGTFTINRELICFADYLKRSGLTSSVLLDDNSNPVKIENIDEFLNEITSRYSAVTNDYLAEYQDIRKSRNVQSILKLKENNE